MDKIQLRTFSLSKTGREGTSQDAYACSADGCRYAVADGVSRSYHPEFTARALCSAFIADNCTAAQWVDKFDSEVLPGISEAWNAATLAFEQEMQKTPSMARYIAAWRQSLPMGSSTFAGITIDPARHSLDYCILGDTTLFVIPDGDAPFRAYCSQTHLADDMITYDNHPDCVSNDAQYCEGTPKLLRYGAWELGSLQLQPGYVALLTDGAAKWLQAALTAGSSAADALWALETHEHFEAFAQSIRTEGEMDDDLTILLFKVPRPAPTEPEKPDQYAALFNVAWIYPFYIDE